MYSRSGPPARSRNTFVTRQIPSAPSPRTFFELSQARVLDVVHHRLLFPIVYVRRNTTNSTGNLREREIKYVNGRVRGEIYGEAKC